MVSLRDCSAMPKIQKTEQEWRAELTPEQYRVLREKGTEAPFSGEYDFSFEPGSYRCAGCGAELFEAETKYDSGCGWPAFYAPASYETLLGVFWAKHDPTQLNRQGWDVGDQYRSVIFFHDSEQQEIAARSKAEEQTRHRQPVVTLVEPAETFYPAEDYHQQYLEKRGRSSCTPALQRQAV